MAKYKVKSDYIALNKAKQKTAKGEIFERDIMTINPLEDLFTPGQDVIHSDSNFKFSVRTDQDKSKKHTKNSWLLNPDDEEVWTLSDVDSSPVSDETEVRIKPDYSSLRDFAYYGSAVEMIRATVNHVIKYFPAELYFTGEKFEEFEGEGDYYLVSNQFDIVVDVDYIDETKVDNPYRFLCLHAGNYDVYKDGKYQMSGTTKGNFSENKEYVCGNGILGTVTITGGTGGKVFSLTQYMYEGKKYLLYTDTSYNGYSIRPCDIIVNEYFGTIDEFEFILLNRKTKPLYKAVFETPFETDEGNKYTMESYIWPSINDWNPLIDGISYESYINALVNLAIFHDEYDSNIIWRMLTHEAIKNLDWTFLRKSEDTVEDLSQIDSSKIEAFIQLYGRQFDGLKRYIDTIKSVNNVSYDEKNNLPNYMLTDVVELGGFDAVLPIATGKTDVMSEPLYSARTEGYSEVDANNYYMRVLKINEHYLNSIKGTRFGVETILRLLGIKQNEYQINEYVAVASGATKCEFSDELSLGDAFYPRATNSKYPSAKDVISINLNKSEATIEEYDTYFDGIAVKAFRSMSESAVTDYNPLGEYYYAIPWYENGKHYDGDWYFQSKGGWGKTDKKKIENRVVEGSNVKAIDGVPFIYDESESYLKFAESIQELKGFFKSEVYTDMICYVTDITDIEETANTSHYFVLMDDDNIGVIGDEGWKNIPISEIREGTTDLAKKVLYLENIVETTEGNNPHISNGFYDDGIDYLEHMNQIFKYQLEQGDEGLVRFSDTDKKKISDCYIFGISNKYEDLIRDNRKCDYYYNPIITASTLNVSGGSSVLSSKIKQGKISDVYSANTKDVKIYDNVSGNTGHYDGKEYSINPESGDKNEEPAANSVINVKNMEIKFLDKPSIANSGSLSGCWQTYITDVVMNYVKQMLPSTTIFKWWFTDKLGNNDSPDTPVETKYFYFNPDTKNVDAGDTFADTTLISSYNTHTIRKPDGVN